MTKKCVVQKKKIEKSVLICGYLLYSSHTSFITGIIPSACLLLLPYGEGRNNIGNNVEGDKAEEICNCGTKGVVQGMGANKIANAIMY